MPEIDLRPEVRWFAEQMERKLRENDHKGGWEDDTIAELLVRLLEEVREVLGTVGIGPSSSYERSYLRSAREHICSAERDLEGLDVVVHADARKSKFLRELADVANFCMMLADNHCGESGAKPKPEKGP